jgi:hypothetical protein
MQGVGPAEHAVGLVQQLLVGLVCDVHHTRHAAGACGHPVSGSICGPDPNRAHHKTLSDMEAT